MTRIAPVHLAFNPKTLWFDAGEMEIGKTDFVVVETARGVELGHMAGEVFEATEEQIDQLKSELRDVLRIADEEDIARGEEMEELSREAMHTFKELAAEYNEDMHPVAVEYLLEGDKAVFYFEAEERLDFREIVRELASRFHVRIDMRQIGVRDEARMIGGLGHCGQELCCKRLGGEFCPVSIRMAKEQDLSLNPQKISGVCGRLMCCLRYEYDAYKDFHSRAPKQNATIQTPDGPAKVSGLDVPREIVDMKIEVDGKTKTVHVPLKDMDEPEEGSNRPKSVSEEAWRSAIEPPLSAAASGLFLTSQFTGNDKLGDARAVRRNNANVKNATGSTSMVELPQKPSRRRRSRSESASAASGADTMRVRRRRSTTVSADGEKTVTKEVHAQEGAPKAEESATRRRRRGRGGQRVARVSESAPSAESAEKPASRSARRPGQRSSSLAVARDEGSKAPETEGSARRRRRRRSGQGSREGGESEAPKTNVAASAASGADEKAASSREESGGRGRSRRRRSRRSSGAPKKEGESHEA